MDNKTYIDEQDRYIVIKLINDTLLISILKEQNDNTVTLLYPMSIDVQDNELSNNKLIKNFISSPLCYLSDEPVFVIDKSHILYMNKLSTAMATDYKKLLLSDKVYILDKGSGFKASFLKGSMIST